MAVPAIFLDGEEFGNGRMTIQDILSSLGSKADPAEFNDKDPYDVLIIGGGPASGSVINLTTNAVSYDARTQSFSCSINRCTTTSRATTDD